MLGLVQASSQISRECSPTSPKRRVQINAAGWHAIEADDGIPAVEREYKRIMDAMGRQRDRAEPIDRRRSLSNPLYFLAFLNAYGY
jgi:hypothetical protein